MPVAPNVSPLLNSFPTLSFPATQHVGASTPSPSGASLGWGQSSATITIDINFADLTLAVPLILGDAFRTVLTTGGVTAINVDAGGINYPASVQVTLFGGGGSGATARAVVDGNPFLPNVGAITSIVVTNPGVDYTSAPAVNISGIPGGGAAATATVAPLPNRPALARIMPMRHPYLTNFVCTRISQAQPLAFVGKLAGAPGPISVPPTALFKYFRLTCVFEPVDYNVVDDATLYTKYNGDESLRCVRYRRANTLQALSRRGQDFIWTEGPGVAAKQPIPFGLVQQLAKQQIIATWLKVPEACLFSNYALGPAPFIEAAYGGVNAAAWKGYPAQTVFFDNWQPTPVPHPYPAGLNDLILPQRLWDVEMSFRIFDPPPGGTRRGWNLQPYPDGKWYFAGQMLKPSVGILPAVDFNDIWNIN